MNKCNTLYGTVETTWSYEYNHNCVPGTCTMVYINREGKVTISYNCQSDKHQQSVVATGQYLQLLTVLTTCKYLA